MLHDLVDTDNQKPRSGESLVENGCPYPTPARRQGCTIWGRPKIKNPEGV